MKKHFVISIIIIAIPIILFLLGKSDSEIASNIGQLAELLFLSPGFVAQDKLFGFQKDIGLLPTNLGRVLVTLFYLLVYWLVVLLIRKRGRNEASHS